MMERVEPAGRGERKMGLRWRLICEGRLVWFVFGREQGRRVFGCPPQKEKKGKVLLKGGLSAVCCGKEQEENQASFLP
jgi:hypothetical protein